MKKKKILITFILAVLATYLCFWSLALNIRLKLLPFPYGPPSYPGMLQPFSYYPWWLPAFVLAFWFLTLITIWWVVKLVVRKIKPEKVELEKIVDTGKVLSKKQGFLIFITSILLMLALSFTASKIFGYCQEIGKDVYKMFNQANYCQEDSDCVVFSDVQCPFSCGWPVNKDADLGPIKEKMSHYFNKGCQTCEYMCAPPALKNLHCFQGRCEIAEEISKEAPLSIKPVDELYTYVDDKLKNKLGERMTLSGSLLSIYGYYIKTEESQKLGDFTCLFIDDIKLLKVFEEKRVDDALVSITGVVEKSVGDYGECDGMKAQCGTYLKYCVRVEEIE